MKGKTKVAFVVGVALLFVTLSMVGNFTKEVVAAGKVFPGESVLQESSVENAADTPPEEEKKATVKKKAPKKGKGK